MGSVGIITLQNVARNGTAERQVAKSGRRSIRNKTDADGRYDANREFFHCPYLMIRILF